MSNTPNLWNRSMTRLPTKSIATQKGIEDFKAGVSIDACPYPHDTAPRKHWLAAFIDARSRERLKHVYEKYPDPPEWKPSK